ncbi:MAG: radical SAM protein [Candidatus Bathyarchaeia archaeon]
MRTPKGSIATTPPLKFKREATMVCKAPLAETGVPELKERKTPFVKPFSNLTPGIVCCPFMEIVFATGCPYDCQYCYLRGTFRRGIVPKPTLYSNWRRMIHEVQAYLTRLPTPTVFHTGELADSLAMPPAARTIAALIEVFAKQDKHKLLLLTKSANVESILHVEHARQTVVGFSLNPPQIAQTFETGAAHPSARLDAAQKCLDAGYPVVFRLDPMIPEEGWERTYECLLDCLNGWSIRGVAIGSLRAYPILLRFISPKLRTMLKERDLSGRWRIPEHTRIEMYSFAMSRLTHPFIGICKEPGSIWGPLATKHKKKFLCNCRL